MFAECLICCLTQDYYSKGYIPEENIPSFESLQDPSCFLFRFPIAPNLRDIRLSRITYGRAFRTDKTNKPLCLNHNKLNSIDFSSNPINPESFRVLLQFFQNITSFNFQDIDKAKKKKELCFSFPRASFFGSAWIFFLLQKKKRFTCARIIFYKRAVVFFSFYFFLFFILIFHCIVDTI